MKNLKTPAQRPRKAPSNQTGGTAWGKKLAAEFSRMVQSADMKKLILLNFPYIIAFYMMEKAAWLYRHCNGDSVVDRLMVLFMNFGLAYKSVLPSFHPFDLMVGLVGVAALKAVIYFKGKNAKKYRQGEEYGSARWGNQKDIEPFIDPVFENNVILTQTERLMMSGRPKHPKYARNKNVIVIGGSGSGKTRFYVKPNLMQTPQKVSYVVTDPKGTIIIECGKMLSDAGYKIKVLNTINFKKSMRYNPFHYIRSEKDILKLVNTIIANTKGDGEKSGEDFWVKAERLLYCALIGYIWYEAPEEEQNFSTLLEFINASEAREDDEEFKNPVDELFEELEQKKPEHFAVRQYKKYKLAAGDIYLLLMPLLVILASNLLFEELDNDTLKNLVTVPVNRTKLVLSKMLVLLLFAVGFMAVGGLVNLAVLLFQGWKPVGFWTLFGVGIEEGLIMWVGALPCILLVVLLNKNYIVSVVITFFYTIANYILSMNDMFLTQPFGLNIGTLFPGPLAFRWTFQFYDQSQTSAELADLLERVSPYFLNGVQVFGVIIVEAIVFLALIAFVYRRQEI